MFSNELLSSRIKHLRINANVNQETFGKAIGLKKSSLSMIENGHRAVSIETLVAIADYFNVSLDYLVGRSDTPERQP